MTWKPLPDPQRGLVVLDAEPLSWGPAALGKEGTEPPTSTPHCGAPALKPPPPSGADEAGSGPGGEGGAGRLICVGSEEDEGLSHWTERKAAFRRGMGAQEDEWRARPAQGLLERRAQLRPLLGPLRAGERFEGRKDRRTGQKILSS